MDMYSFMLGAKSGGGGGGSSGVMVVHCDADTYAYDKTWQEINDAVASGMVVTVHFADGDNQLTLVAYCGEENGTYIVETWSPRNYDVVWSAYADSPNGYPVLD